MTGPPVAVVTGATSGLGYATSLALAGRGYLVVLVSRDRRRGARAAETAAAAASVAPQVVHADLEDLASVERAAGEITTVHERVDLLISNAGVLVPERSMTNYGVERTFQVNHLAHFLLTSLLEPALLAAPAARIVTVASDLHVRGRIDLDDLNGNRAWDPWQAYCNSKLANVLFAHALADRLAGTRATSNALHPGVLASNFGREMTRSSGGGSAVFQPFGEPPSAGARAVLYLATDPGLERVTGEYFDRMSAGPPSAAANDPSLRLALWAQSQRLLASAGHAGAFAAPPVGDPATAPSPAPALFPAVPRKATSLPG